VRISRPSPATRRYSLKPNMAVNTKDICLTDEVIATCYEMVPGDTDSSHNGSERLRAVRAIIAGVVQIVGIVAVMLIEIAAIQNGTNGETLPLVIGAIMLLVGVRAREVLDNFLPGGSD